MLVFPIKRKFSPEDQFFSLGNIEIRSEWLKKHSTLQIEKTQIIKEQLHEEFRYINKFNYYIYIYIYKNNNFSLLNHSSKSITCQFPPWCQTHPIRFPSVSAYEIHYNTSHRHICNECNKVFPSERWLKLHLTENHDVIIKIKKERGEKTVSRKYKIKVFFFLKKLNKIYILLIKLNIHYYYYYHIV
jgi:hypothetical protein